MVYKEGMDSKLVAKRVMYVLQVISTASLRNSNASRITNLVLNNMFHDGNLHFKIIYSTARWVYAKHIIYSDMKTYTKP